MEFDFNINYIFPDIITLVTRDLIRSKRIDERTYQQRLEQVIDILGKRSAKAQMLSGSITSLQKSLLNNHHIYVLKDPHLNKGLGSIIGFIKVGKKRLFLLNHEGSQNEIYPLCVLDFYVHESQQRRGCGLRLFKHMLQKECVKPSHMAIDRPSHKFLSFFKKHFNMTEKIPQVNNFVIFDGFFDDRSDVIRTNNERFSNFRIRPLSRAVSDDVIRCNRETTGTRDLRPASGQTEGYGFLMNRNNRRRRWNPDGSLSSNNNNFLQRPNFYSRFAHNPTDTNSSSPSVQRNFKEVINHHICTDPFSNPSFAESAGDANDPANNSSPRTEKRSTIARPSTFQKAVDKETKKEDHDNGIVSTQPFVPPSHDRASASNLLKELKDKDDASLRDNAVANFSRYRRRWHERNSNRATSWNVFGVPTAPGYWTLK